MVLYSKMCMYKRIKAQILVSVLKRPTAMEAGVYIHTCMYSNVDSGSLNR